MARTGTASLADPRAPWWRPLGGAERLGRVVVVAAARPLDDVVEAVEHELRALAGALAAGAMARCRRPATLP